MNRWELHVIKNGGLLFIIAHLYAAYDSPLNNLWLFAIGLILLCLSGVFFIAAMRVFKTDAPAVAFANEILTPLKTNGVYKVVRHPFYTAYSLAWIGGTIATGYWWLSISVIVMGYVYYKAASEEEQQWQNGPMGELYKGYQKTTGMFFPSLLSVYFLFKRFFPNTSNMNVQLSTSQEEKEAIYKFRYNIYVEEFQKLHIPANHEAKKMEDLNDAYTANYYTTDSNNILTGVARAHRGSDGAFLAEDTEMFELEKFSAEFGINSLSVVNRLAIATKYRHTPLTTKFFIATYLGGLEKGVKLCFILSEVRLLPMYRHFGFRVLGSPIEIGNPPKTRYRMVLCLHDKQYILACGSPFANLLPDEADDKGKTADRIKKMGYAFS